MATKCWYRVHLDGEGSTDMRTAEDERDLIEMLAGEGTAYARIEPFDDQMRTAYDRLTKMVDGAFESGRMDTDEYDAMIALLACAESDAFEG